MLKTFDFSSNDDYSRVSTEVVGGYGQLVLVDLPDQDFVEDFGDDTDFVFDGNKSEFSGGKNQQKDLRPAGCVLYASFTNDKNASWGNGTLISTIGSGTTIHDGYLDMSNGGNEWLEFPIDNFASMTSSAGCIKTRRAFTYSGSASSIQYLIQTSSSSTSRVYLVHNAGFLQCYITNTGGSTIYSMTVSWTPSAGTIYEFEVNWNTTKAYLFVNGNKIDEASGSLGIAAPSLFRLGQGSNGKQKVYDIAVFDTLQHSSNYTPNWSAFYETAYLETKITLPEIEDTQPGFIRALSNLIVVSEGTERYTLQIGRSGNYLYHDGDNWVTSNRTFAQASPVSDFIDHAEDLPVQGETYGQFEAYYPGSNTQGYIDNLTVTMTLQEYASQGTFETLDYFDAAAISALVGEITESGNNKVYLVMKTDNDYVYHNGSAWVESDKSVSQANTLTEVGSEITSLLEENQRCKIYINLVSEDGTETPKIDYLTVTYTFGGLEPLDGNMAYVYGYVKDLEENPIEDATVTIEVNIGANEYCETASKMRNKKIIKTTNEEGYFIARLPWSSEFDSSGDITYKITVEKTDIISITEKDGEDIEFTVPDSTEYLNITDRIEMAA